MREDQCVQITLDELGQLRRMPTLPSIRGSPRGRGGLAGEGACWLAESRAPAGPASKGKRHAQVSRGFASPVSAWLRVVSCGGHGGLDRGDLANPALLQSLLKRAGHRSPSRRSTFSRRRCGLRCVWLAWCTSPASTFRAQLAACETLYGAWSTIPSPLSVRLLAAAGLDYVVVDSVARPTTCPG